jgi:hypothetical protein
MASPVRNFIPNLSYDIALKSFEHVDPKSLSRAAAVSRAWAGINIGAIRKIQSDYVGDKLISYLGLRKETPEETRERERVASLRPPIARETLERMEDEYLEGLSRL